MKMDSRAWGTIWWTPWVSGPLEISIYEWSNFGISEGGGNHSSTLKLVLLREKCHVRALGGVVAPERVAPNPPTYGTWV